MSEEQAPGAGNVAPSVTTATTPASGAAESVPNDSSPRTDEGSTSDEAASSGFDFGSMFDEKPDSELPLAVAPTAPKEPKEPAPPKPPEPAPPVQKPAEPVQPPAQAQQLQQPAAAPPTAQQQIDPFDPGALSQHLLQNEEAAIQYTADHVFKLSQSEIEALETNAAEAVPRLMAKAFVKSQENALSQLSRMVPAMIQRHLENVKRNDTNESKFYARWPGIKPDEHGAMVRKYAAVYRQMHPDTTLEQMIEDLGPMVMMAARIVPQVPSGGVVPKAPANPVSQPTAAGRPTPFVPAGAGAVNSSQGRGLNPIEIMFQDHG
jgi:hypothetical protein